MEEQDQALSILREANIVPEEQEADPWQKLLSFGFVKEIIAMADNFNNSWQTNLTKDILKEGFLKLKDSEVTQKAREWVIERVAPSYVQFLLDRSSAPWIEETCSFYDHALACLEVAETNFRDSEVMDRIGNAFYYATRKISNEEINRMQPKPGEAF